MKMVLILTNKDDITVDFVVKELKRRNVSYYRLNTEDIPDPIAVEFDVSEDSFLLKDHKKDLTLNLHDISSAYFRRAQVSSLEYLTNINMQERNYLRGELAFLIEGIYKVLENCYWLNNVYRIREAENKIYQLQLARKVGFRIPTTQISNCPETIADMGSQYNKDCIMKPIKSGNIDPNVSNRIIFTSKVRESVFEEEERIKAFPVFIQNNIHKKSDLRRIVVGEHVYCAQIDSQRYTDSQIDWRRGKEVLPHAVHKLPDEIKEKCIEITRMLCLNYSAIDLILDQDGNYIFLECNPNGQWAWLETRLGFPISRDIVEMLYCEEE